MSEDLVRRAEALARAVHEGQTDRGGAPYHLHLQRVAGRCHGGYSAAVAWLHDAVEDTELTVEHVFDSFGRDIGEAVALLTHDIEATTYREYVDRIHGASYGSLGGSLALTVKVADLLDNCDPRRKVPEDPEFYERSMVKHWRALNRLLCGSWPT